MQKNSNKFGNILTNLKIDALNEMQEASIKANQEHKDVILLSATGSGKTLAFLLPVLERLKADNKKTQALVVVPSRELALQIEKVFRQMTTGYKVTACYGGHLRETEENNLIEAPALIVGTPGRLGDHIRRGNIVTDGIETLVLDEFDKTLELGFQEEVGFIVESLPNVKKHILTSATEGVDIPEFLVLEAPARLDFLPEDGNTAPRLELKQVLAPENDKVDTLFRLICHLGNRSTIVFCNHREAVERTSKMISEKGILNTFYHGAMEQRDRDVALTKFRNGTVNVLVTTDLAARGLDIPHIRYIIHFHLPHTEDSWTHRNGRTARMEASGTAIVVLAPDEKLMSYLEEEQVSTIELPEKAVLPEKPKWVTIFIGAGKKDKVNKIDIVGFLSKKGQLKKDDIGLVDVKDFFSFAAIVRSKMSFTLELIKNEKIKNKKVKIDMAK
ncbi:ATP-dependent helicase [Chitinophaga silvatica]|uniref:ATP-dependent helicase n=1 Tax=Chitinophaga silvatica TaxID=2282649 RepID=A0A3E1YGR0_9BACT|nr:DEAD/DEAH box helicase [Chitinophaga silvatica]RFS26390.1 ATP-dependent helicase [Chitinophaga silvatica]